MFLDFFCMVNYTVFLLPRDFVTQFFPSIALPKKSTWRPEEDSRFCHWFESLYIVFFLASDWNRDARHSSTENSDVTLSGHKTKEAQLNIPSWPITHNMRSNHIMFTMTVQFKTLTITSTIVMLLYYDLPQKCLTGAWLTTPSSTVLPTDQASWWWYYHKSSNNNQADKRIMFYWFSNNCLGNLCHTSHCIKCRLKQSF